MDNNMDCRCPRKLDNFPDSWCPLAVLRLKAIRNAGKELSEEEECRLPGCEWAIGNQLANYCFFKYIYEVSMGKPPSDAEMASMLSLAVDTIRRVERQALIKIRKDPVMVEISTVYGDDPVMDQEHPDQWYDIPEK